MTSVIRVKRRIADDPVEALRLSCKRQRQNETGKAVAIESVFNFAGTLQSKDEPVSTHIREAIRKNKLHKELHPHSADFKQHVPHRGKTTNKLREETEASSRKNRYKVTLSKRALELAELDKGVDSTGDKGTRTRTVNGLKKVPTAEPEDLDDENDKENSSAPCDCTSESIATKSPADIIATGNVSLSERSAGDSQSSVTISERPELDGNKKSVLKEDKMFCMFDVEDEDNELFEQAKQASHGGITVNNVPMVSTRAPLAESEYVYDLYFTHNSLGDLDRDAVLTVETLCHDLVQDERARLDDDDLVYDDDDDSNDESNWRNDYPDEDPHFFENENVDYDYSEGMLDSNVLDDGDLLAQWMDTRCTVGVESDDDGDEDYEKEKDSSDSEIDY